MYQALVVLILFSLTPSHGRPRPSFALPILTTLPALTENQLLWLMIGASGGAGVALGAQGISNIAQVCFLSFFCPLGPKLKVLACGVEGPDFYHSAISMHKPS